MSNKSLNVDDVFVLCSNHSECETGYCDLVGVGTTFWPVLNNTVSIVDLGGVYAMTGHTNLNSAIFSEFFGAFARVKYPTGHDYREKLLEDVTNGKGIRINSDNPAFLRTMDKAVIRTLLKFDLPLRRAFSAFASRTSGGGGLTWDEVKRLSVGMEVSGFIGLLSSQSLIPASLSASQCETIIKDVMRSFPILATAASLHSIILYPQFQLALSFIALEKIVNANKRIQFSSRDRMFAKKLVDVDSKPMCDIVLELLKSLGIDKSGPGVGLSSKDQTIVSTENSKGGSFGETTKRGGTMKSIEGRDDEDNDEGMDMYNGNYGGGFDGSVTMPMSQRPEDHYSGSMNHSRQAMLLRMEHLFDEIETKLLGMAESGSEALELLAAPSDEINEVRQKLSSKPVVIGDAVPVPTTCPEVVEQLLQAALAHHNLGSFEESLKFLEASRLQLLEIERRIWRSRMKHQEEMKTSPEKLAAEAMAAATGATLGAAATTPAPASTPAPAPAAGAAADAAVDEPSHFDKPDHEYVLPLDLDMYIMICKGNVYQSCGDDEQSLMQYMAALARATEAEDKDWELLCMNSIGILAYYSLRYDVAFMCFSLVANYRASEYGLNSADTATAWNNEACSLFCMNKRRDSRVRFERAWNTMCKALGHRAPRSVTVWKNLEKARRAHASLTNKDFKESADLRPDADKLLLGGKFTIKATGPPETIKKKKGGGGGKKKKK